VAGTGGAYRRFLGAPEQRETWMTGAPLETRHHLAAGSFAEDSTMARVTT